MYTIYGKKNCSGCEQVKATMDRENIPYEYVDIDVDLGAKTRIVNMGFRTVPVVLDDEGNHVTGKFRRT